ncbi:MAG: DNA polymerase III subunit gamma/tau, partial [Pseudomonadota bacterium]
TPEELVRKLQDAPPAPNGGGGGRKAPAVTAPTAPVAQSAAPAPQAAGPSGTATALATAPDTALARYASFESVVELIRANR